MSPSLRLDRLLVEKSLVESRQKAQALIMAGKVRVDGNLVDKAGSMVRETANLKIIGTPLPYVSRGGIKLAGALDHFDITPDGWVCMDVGASTGGFTDCLLKRGARQVYAVDVGYGQLAFKLRQDPRVVVIERTNIRHMDSEQIPVPIDFAVVDVSFISLKIVIPRILTFLTPTAGLVALIKPQFEVGKGLVGKKGVVRDTALHARVKDEIEQFCIQLGMQVKGVIPSDIRGPKGNQEYLIHACFSESA